MHIITDDSFLACGLRALFDQRLLNLAEEDAIVDFDNHFLIMTTLPTLKTIMSGDHSFEQFLLQPFFKIEKRIAIKALPIQLKYRPWRQRKYTPPSLLLTRKERAILTYVMNSEYQNGIFDYGELDSKTLSTHKYNLLRKVNLRSIAALAQVHMRWKTLSHLRGFWPESACSKPARARALRAHQPFYQANALQET
ncbi:LuxR C-terminal-related transcriptional regulator [Enterobacter asburiae]|nr:LuxR C-terminal-related transcriptional regulator [Enterobacter asburiae]